MRYLSLVLVLWFVGASSAQRPPKPVMVSFLPLLESAQNIAEKRLKVELFLPAGASPHTFDPTPRDVLRVRQAGLLLLSGYGIDAWLERLWRVDGRRNKLVKLAEQASFARIGTGNAVDAHVWLDASIMGAMALEMGEAFAAHDPTNAAFYRQQAKLEQQRLLGLHKELQQRLEPIRGAGLVVFHNAWNYFVRAYDLRVLAMVRTQADRDPSAKEIADLLTVMQQHKVKAIFTEPQLPDRAAKAIASDVGAKIFVLDPEGSSLSENYTQMMRYNAKTLLEALR
jgi:ABC-type Zn uptake system ZnuABC Zn-binding protein ZnuA